MPYLFSALYREHGRRCAFNKTCATEDAEALRLYELYVRMQASRRSWSSAAQPGRRLRAAREPPAGARRIAACSSAPPP